MSEITVQGLNVKNGEHAIGQLPVTMLANGYELKIPFHVLNGAKPGKKLMLSAVSHGDAMMGMEIIRQVMERVDLNELSGTLITVPCQNPIGFEWGERNTPNDMYNMNRAYPGNPNGWFSEQIAAAISPLCDDADMLIDWHGGSYGRAINYVLINNSPDALLTEQIRQMAFAYGLEYIYDGKPAGPQAQYAGSLNGYMLSLGKPSIVAEVGAGIHLSMNIVETGVQGVINVMQQAGMLKGKPVLPKTQWIVKERPLVRPSQGGIFYPVCGPEYLNKVVPKGTLLSYVRNPLTLEVIEEICAPCDESIIMCTRALMTKVHPGDYGYIIGNLANAERYDNV